MPCLCPVNSLRPLHFIVCAACILQSLPAPVLFPPPTSLCVGRDSTQVIIFCFCRPTEYLLAVGRMPSVTR
jgi:hypothetical protein